MRITRVMLTAATLSLGLAVVPGCNRGNKDQKASKRKPPKMKIGDKAVGAGGNDMTAKIASFDPNADMDLDKWGSERPDDYAVLDAFYATYPKMDDCVAAEKKRRKSEDQLLGEVDLAVKLNPEKNKPFGVNAVMPEGLAKATKLKDCLREAAASGSYPKYDGPPLVVDFSAEIDPGEE